MSNFKEKYRIKELFEEVVGDTSALKAEFSAKYHIPIAKVNRYCRREAVFLPHKDAIRFLNFFNSKKHKDAKIFELSDIYEDITKNIKL
jgi:hypothetical protein